MMSKRQKVTFPSSSSSSSSSNNSERNHKKTGTMMLNPNTATSATAASSTAASASATSSTAAAAAAASSTVTATSATVKTKPRSPEKTYIAKLILQMKDCLTQLDAKNVTMPRLEQMAILIHESMSNSSRNYHSVQHVFDISKGMTDPIAILSAFFHDCIYYHVDGGLSKVQAEILKGMYQEQQQLVSTDSSSPRHKFFASSPSESESESESSSSSSSSDARTRLLSSLVECIFDYAPGQEITTYNGLNEFLSAIIAVRELQDHLELQDLAKIACCIESTIPFRRKHPTTHQSPLDQLFQSMKRAQYKFQLPLTETDLVQSIQRAAILSNNDVGNFGTADRHWFLDNTWSLLPETNETLRQQYLYTVKEFHHGIFKMYGFFGFVQPAVVFQSFRGVPSPDELSTKLEQCTLNLQIGKKYVGAKLLAVSVLAAFAELTGGDAPMSLFMGDLPSRHGDAATSSNNDNNNNNNDNDNNDDNHDDNHDDNNDTSSWPDPPSEDFKTQQQQSQAERQSHHHHCDPDVYQILVQGRRIETSFDIRQSPLAAYLYGYLGDAKVQELLERLTFYPMERANSLELLSSLPRLAVEAIAQNMIKVALSRADIIQQVVDDLSSSSSDGSNNGTNNYNNNNNNNNRSMSMSMDVNANGGSSPDGEIKQK